MYKIGLSTCGKVIDKELFENYKKSGIDTMEISVSWDKYAALNYKEMLSLSKTYGVELWSYHLPFWPFSEIDISNKETCRHTIEYWSELIKKASDIGIDKFVIHASGEPIDDADRRERMECAKESLIKLAEIASSNGGVIAVEDLPRSCLGKNSEEIRELISVDDRLKVCFDTNHLLGEAPADFVRSIGNKIITTHVSDYDFVDERHWLPGEGKINWNELIKALEDINYNGPWLYEIPYSDPDQIIRDRDLTCADFSDNAKSLFRR